ncbi:helix-turn-helix domain-containing protein [Ancylobacter rudongensis]|uniref:HTH cro/C1-type domain-containing protein n=1 Tax=Ancylobacter rudongensis TaxID=177413 RepID=A0A1G4UQ11_9HYPH|nr:helix-turn-helix transcriptional regulator [Ancylobacter rudongensis]SCW95751.1 hypothetical protein SAMN05660859_0109 [Ancylobacter rudongensis]
MKRSGKSDTLAAKRLSLRDFVIQRVDELKPRKSQKDIAAEAGYPSQNMISQLKLGTSKLAIDRVPLLAKALDVDPAYLLRLAFGQYYTGETIEFLDQVYTGQTTDNEREILNFIREVSGDRDPKLNEGSKALLREAFGVASADEDTTAQSA